MIPALGGVPRRPNHLAPTGSKQEILSKGLIFAGNPAAFAAHARVQIAKLTLESPISTAFPRGRAIVLHPSSIARRLSAPVHLAHD
jgi:hypothetical protein